jgi:hypothetical protein
VKRGIRTLDGGKCRPPGRESNGNAESDRRRNLNRKREDMNKIFLSICLALVTSFVYGQRLPLGQPLMETEHTTSRGPQRTTTTTTTEASGTITQYTPGSAIVLRESNGPVRYRFGKTVTYATRSGKVLDAATVNERIRVGVPVRVHYTGTGPNMVVDRVILEED